MKNKKIKYKYHSWNDLQPLCNQYFVHDTGIAYSDETVTCKRCKKILKKEYNVKKFELLDK